jgi:hypothetical protein
MEYMCAKSMKIKDYCLMYFCFCFLKVLREVRCQSWGILVSHPFQGRISDFFVLKENYLIDN